jgi:hypothetical protein
MQEYARICIGAYFAYFAYICTPHFADAESKNFEILAPVNWSMTYQHAAILTLALPLVITRRIKKSESSTSGQVLAKTRLISLTRIDRTVWGRTVAAATQAGWAGSRRPAAGPARSS